MKSVIKYFAIFLVLYQIFYFLLLTAPMQNFMHGAFETTVAPVLITAFSQTKMAVTPAGKKNEWIVDYYSIPELEKQTAIAKKAGRSSLDIVSQRNTIDGNQFFTNSLPLLWALILATPIFWRAKIISFLLGTLTYWILATGIIYFKIYNAISGKQIGVYELNGISADIVKFLADASKVGFLTLLTILVWQLVVSSKNNIAYIKNKLNIRIEE